MKPESKTGTSSWRFRYFFWSKFVTHHKQIQTVDVVQENNYMLRTIFPQITMEDLQLERVYASIMICINLNIIIFNKDFQ